MFTCSHANMPLGQSERAYYLSYFINRYVPPQRVWFLHGFGLKMGIDFAHFSLESGMVFEETTGVVYLSFQFQMNKKEREIWEFKMDFFYFFLIFLSAF